MLYMMYFAINIQTRIPKFAMNRTITKLCLIGFSVKNSILSGKRLSLLKLLTLLAESTKTIFSV